jgi:hypothetical protein
METHFNLTKRILPFLNKNCDFPPTCLFTKDARLNYLLSLFEFIILHSIYLMLFYSMGVVLNGNRKPASRITKKLFQKTIGDGFAFCYDHQGS